MNGGSCCKTKQLLLYEFEGEKTVLFGILHSSRRLYPGEGLVYGDITKKTEQKEVKVEGGLTAVVYKYLNKEKRQN